MRRAWRTIGFLVAAAFPAAAQEPLRVATAANFATVTDALVAQFSADRSRAIVVISGATGLLYAQILNGAPFDVFLAADTTRPVALESQGFAVRGSRTPYAIGRLALWSSTRNVPDSALLFDSLPLRLALAKPQTAPYGNAAVQVLQALGVWDRWSAHLIRGENISQVYQFVASGAADLGFVALEHVAGRVPQAYWIAPAGLHQPILQEAVLLVRAVNDPDARALLSYLTSDAGRATIRRFHYELPPHP